jgi:hypothetical protein
MTMRIHTQLLTLEHCWNISTGNCLTTLLIALISLQATTTCLPTYLPTYLPEKLAGITGFNNNEKLMEGVKMWLSSQAADFFETGIQELIPRHDKCLNSCSDYVEK